MKDSVNLYDLKNAYRYKSNSDLKLSYLIFRILQVQWLLGILKGCAIGIVKYKLPFKGIIKKTIFKLFCAGETIDEAVVLVKKLQEYNVKSVLDYVSEGERTESAFLINTQIIICNIIKLSQESQGNFISIKLSGLEDPEFLTKVNSRRLPEEGPLKIRVDRLIERIDLICYTGKKHGVVIYFDAEDRCMQDIIDVIVEMMMEKYNTESVYVFNTVQMYLKDRLFYINSLIAYAKQKYYILGIKLVRGAYVEKEREMAKLRNVESPVFDTKEETDHSFDEAVDLCLRNQSVVETCIATHNYKSTLLALDCIRKYNIVNAKDKVKFSQLFGMCDGITFNLASAGYSVSKYLPYGEVQKAIPYLIRRADENTSINGQVNDELNRIKAEIKNRRHN